jgi:hypothetical protein
MKRGHDSSFDADIKAIAPPPHRAAPRRTHAFPTNHLVRLGFDRHELESGEGDTVA